MLLENERDYGFIPPPSPAPHPRCKNLFNHTTSYRRRLHKHVKDVGVELS